MPLVKKRILQGNRRFWPIGQANTAVSAEEMQQAQLDEDHGEAKQRDAQHKPFRSRGLSNGVHVHYNAQKQWKVRIA
jgi:hypothetical protein